MTVKKPALTPEPELNVNDEPHPALDVAVEPQEHPAGSGLDKVVFGVTATPGFVGLDNLLNILRAAAIIGERTSSLRSGAAAVAASLHRRTLVQSGSGTTSGLGPRARRR
mgnify:CR=1 FL=1